MHVDHTVHLTSNTAVVRNETTTTEEATISFCGQQQFSQLIENMGIHPVQNTNIILYKATYQFMVNMFEQ
jgi:3-mercaptopyruvate sulfurtransferase SseA